MDDVAQALVNFRGFFSAEGYRKGHFRRKLPPVGGNFSSGSMLCIERRCARRLCATKYVGNIGNKWERPSLLPRRIRAVVRSRSRRRTGNMGEQLCCAVPWPRGASCARSHRTSLLLGHKEGRPHDALERVPPTTRPPRPPSLACPVSRLEYALYGMLPRGYGKSAGQGLRGSSLDVASACRF